MQFTNLTRQNEIGANCYYIQVGESGFLLDCGSHPKIEGNGGLPRLDFLRNRPLNGVFISHGHLDHIGSLPLVLEDFPRVRAYMTHATALIADRALHNSASVMIKQRRELELPEYPFFTHSQVERLCREFQIVPYERAREIDNVDVTYYEAGHVQGAAGIWIQSGDESLFYTGDVKFSDMKITRGARFPDKTPDTIVFECTRGATPSQPNFSWDREIERLAASIRETFERGGSVLIPCFALGKTQEVLKVLYDLMQERVLEEQPIYISGLSSSYNEIYDELSKSHPRVCPGFRLDDKMELTVLEQKEGKHMDLGEGRLMLISSGMMTYHTMSYSVASRIIPDERHSIFFVGYVDPDSPAGKLKKAGTGGVVDLGHEVGQMEVKCKIDSFDFTSHCNREHMLDYLVKVAPRNLVLVHGEAAGLNWFQDQLSQRLPDSHLILPPSVETVDL
jgi:Cft2 family RNA processing exonuclease